MGSVRDRIYRYGLEPKRSLGQNFLIDETHLDQILAVADLAQEDTVLEIGPGLGGLTHRIASTVGRVVAVELDDRLIALLRADFAEQAHVSIVHADILDTSLQTLMGTPAQAGEPSQAAVAPYKVVANLPYYITSAVLRYLLESKTPPRSVVVMVQKEVAQRICAKPGKLSLLAVSVQFYAQPQLVHHVPAGAFYPRPKVDSAVLHLDLFPEPALPHVDPKRFFRIVKAGFGQKRKQLLNSLTAGLACPKNEVIARLEEAEIDPKRRAETLTIDEWGQAYDVLSPIMGG